MTCALIRRPAAAAGSTPARLPRVDRLAQRLRGDDGPAQFARFVFVGGVSSALYALLYVLLDGLGDQPANIAGAIASSMLANELHRRLTFHAGQRVSWFTAQWEGGGLAAAGMVATALALGWFDATTGGDSPTADLLVVGVVTGAIGLIRFIALRWVFGARAPERA